MRRASRWTRGISLLAALLVVWYAFANLKVGAGTRVWVGGIAIATYFLTRTIVSQIAVEVLRGKPSS